MRTRHSRARLHPNTASFSDTDLKRWFLKFAGQECPQFRVTPDNRKAIADIFNWCICADGNLDPAKGLWIYGNIGTGKTTLLRIVKKFCHDVRPVQPSGRPYGFAIVPVSDITTAFSEKAYAGINTYADNPRIAFDDVGAESSTNTHYGNQDNVMQYVFQRRYGRDFITHVTSNLDPGQIIAAYGERVYDRCREMFNFVGLMGKTLR